MIETSRDLMTEEALEGVLDGLAHGAAHGWAWLVGEMRAAVCVEVREGAVVLGRGNAEAFRSDLASAGKRNGLCGFNVELGHVPVSGTVLTVFAVCGDRERELVGSPITVVASDEIGSEKTPTDVFPLPIGNANLQGSLDECGPVRLRGWVRWTNGKIRSPTLALWENGHEVLRFDANDWRPDIAELQQDDGCCGFDVSLPASLRDGQPHVLELCVADTGEAVLRSPFQISIAPEPAKLARSSTRNPAPLVRSPVADPVTLSIVVNFYNMHREAERTLTSLTQGYQRGAADLNYEVICVDNGSSPPLDPDWIAGFGPQFRLVRPSRQLSSPCAALNEAALQARGRYLAVMIDGAHMLTPGVLQEARLAWQENPDAVVAVRHWFIGGDQRWLAIAGYTREQENRLFDRIRWPVNGYDLFRIGAPIGENPEPWFDGLSESNCLMLPTQLYDRIGGFDEAFGDAGGGFANLDLWRRTCEAADGPLVSLVGEASFHQFHGGTTTNVDDAEKDLRVRSYSNAYRALRGEDFVGIHRSLLTFRGRMSSEFCTGIRQRTLLPMRLGITERVRPGQLALHFDDGAQSYLQSVYAECGLQNDVRWLGQPTGVAPADLVSLQEIIFQVQPDAIIAVGAETGLVGFADSILLTMNVDAARVIFINPPSHFPANDRVTVLRGEILDARLLRAVRECCVGAETVLVLHATGPEENFSLATLEAYGSLVSYRSYLICLGTLFGQPWLGYSSRQHLSTIREFTKGHSPFVIDRGLNRQLISTCPSGYLRKVGGAVNAHNYDASLDEAWTDQPLPPENAA